MELTKEKAKNNLKILIAKFESELNLSKIWDYNEEATKTAFIQPFLKDVLGWNVNDRDEVSPEERVSRNRVDYGLKIDGKTKIFVEAKPPKADLNKHIEQAVKYGYNRKTVPFVLLTDFEGLKLFDVTVKPDLRNFRRGLKIDLVWDKYLENFDDIWLLSKESAQSGEIDKIIKVKPKDRLPVDKAILEDLKKWREILAKDIYKNNSRLFASGDREKDAQYLKEITQRLLDRLIFMRFCEDRNFIHRTYLKSLFEGRSEAMGTSTMVLLQDEFKHYNILFDSDLFRPQEWERGLLIDFKVMYEIIMDTYNPYQFDVIPLEVLGNIYEQYLGFAIRLTEQQVKYELKPDVRKAGGVYYTPEYIVDYIVKNTVGKLLQELPASKIKKLRILDPACGSGSFLIRAYEEMLNWYKSQKKTKKHMAPQKCHSELGSESQQLFEHERQEHILSIEEKAQILREHIFGVDIDEQAVEVTKLSLMLKMLEGEFGIIPGSHILPMLEKNIKCGNSLISGETFELMKYFGKDYYKVKPFEWKEQFRKIMIDEGGFDVVIGNPPYIKMQMLQESQSEAVRFLKDNYISASSQSVDIYVIFIERALSLLSHCGLLGYICPHKFFNSNYGRNIRKLILERKNIIRILNFGINQVFENATTYTCLFFLAGKAQPNFQYYKFKDGVLDLEKEIKIGIPYLKIDADKIKINNWVFVNPALDLFLTKIGKEKPILDKITTNIFQGPKSGADQVFILRLLKWGNKKSKCFSNTIKKEFEIESAILRSYVKGKNIKRYYIKRGDEYIIFPYEKNGILLSEYDLKNVCPLAYEYLSDKTNKTILLDREKGRFKRIWWSYSRPQNMKILDREKILTPFNAFRNSFAYDDVGDFIFSAGISGAYGILLKEDQTGSYKYILGILNSSLSDRYLKIVSTALRGGFYSYENKYIKQLPIFVVDFSNMIERKLYEGLVGLVDIMIDLNKKLYTSKGGEKEQIQRQIEKTDKEIDELVYKLYGITEEERRIIER